MTRALAPPRRWRWFGTAPRNALPRDRGATGAHHPGYVQVNRVDRTGRALPGGGSLLVDPTKRTVVGSSGDPDRFDLAAALGRGTRA